MTGDAFFVPNRPKKVFARLKFLPVLPRAKINLALAEKELTPIAKSTRSHKIFLIQEPFSIKQQ